MRFTRLKKTLKKFGLLWRCDEARRKKGRKEESMSIKPLGLLFPNAESGAASRNIWT